MSTKSSFKSRDHTSERPGFHHCEDVPDFLDARGGDSGPPVYLCLDGIATQLETLNNGGATVTVALQRKMACEAGLLPLEDGRRPTRDF